MSVRGPGDSLGKNLSDEFPRFNERCCAFNGNDINGFPTQVELIG